MLKFSLSAKSHDRSCRRWHWPDDDGTAWPAISCAEGCGNFSPTITTCQKHPTELSVTTFCTFLRELSPPPSHYRRPPRIPGDFNGGLGVSECRCELPVAGFPSRRRPASAGGLRPTGRIESTDLSCCWQSATRRPRSHASDSLPRVPGVPLAGRLPTAWGCSYGQNIPPNRNWPPALNLLVFVKPSFRPLDSGAGPRDAGSFPPHVPQRCIMSLLLCPWQLFLVILAAPRTRQIRFKYQAVATLLQLAAELTLTPPSDIRGAVDMGIWGLKKAVTRPAGI
jgi:hypothetical protein